MKFFRQEFRKLSSDRQTDRETRPQLYTTRPRRLAGGQLDGGGASVYHTQLCLERFMLHSCLQPKTRCWFQENNTAIMCSCNGY